MPSCGCIAALTSVVNVCVFVSSLRSLADLTSVMISLVCNTGMLLINIGKIYAAFIAISESAPLVLISRR